ncbi:hypothetical protein TEA_018179 [Camellia sinensis var. sinensis]|uniref:Transcription initiation factor TFIID subunit 10 n=1 Tax=Camellia sinensis var. sinensis TaxID=542762 RepID=A0A4S4D206_CAMSN|nr:hypothetical protein TEA_018179 [Camellia sinensis var. sinensis]
MNHNHSQQSSDGRHDDDTVLSDFLASLMDYTPTIPDQLVEYYLAKSGFQCPDVRLQCKARQAAVVKDKRDKQQSICNWHIVLVRGDGLRNSLIPFRLRPFYADFRFLVLTEQYGVNVKHQEYFSDSPTAGFDPASRDE